MDHEKQFALRRLLVLMDTLAIVLSMSLAVVTHAAVREHFQRVVDELARNATGSATRIARLLLLSEPPSIDSGEVTDKGSINQRAVLQRRDALVQALYDGSAPDIITPSKP